MHYYFGCYDPLQYPLLFPNGESGWHQGTERVNKQDRNCDVSSVDIMLDAHYAGSPEEILKNETACLENKFFLDFSFFIINFYFFSLYFSYAQKARMITGVLP